MKNEDYGEVDHTKFNIDLSIQVMNPSVSKGIAQGRDRWMSIIVGDLPDVPNPDWFFDDGGYCTGIPYPSVIDDTYLCVLEAEIDNAGNGEFNIYGYYKTGSFRETGGLAYEGYIEFDTYDAAQLLRKPGQWETLFLRMMGFAIGFDQLLYFDLTHFDDVTTYYTGANGLKVWQEWGCSGNPPMFAVDSQGYYWDSKCLVNELFTEKFNPKGKLSKLTIAAFEDMGYTVDYNAADKYNVEDILCCKNAGGSGAVSVAEQELPSQEPVLSEAGKAYATTYGIKVLDEQREKLASRRRLQQDNMFTGVDEETTPRTSNSITVIIEENGIIFDFTVSE